MIRPQQLSANTSRLLVLAAATTLLIVGMSQPAQAQTIIDFPWDWTIEIVPRDPSSPPEDPTFGDPIPITLWGRASIAFAEPVGSLGGTFDLSGPVPDNGETYTVDIELVALSLTSIDPISMDPAPVPFPQGLMDFEINLDPNQPSLGQLQGVLNNGDGTFQVDSFFDVWVELSLTSDTGEQTQLVQNAPLPLSMSFGTGNDPMDMGPLPEIDILWTPVWVWEEGLANDLLDLSMNDPLWDKWISIHGHITPEPGSMMLAIVGVASVLCGSRRRRRAA